MKRLIATIFIGLAVTGLAVAQSAGLRSFRQTGAATAELSTDQLVASHPSLSMGTQLKVTNTSNGKEVIVTVTGRIPASGTRIIDLSRGVSARLEMNASGTTPVSIEVVRNTEVAAAPAPAPAPPPPPPPEPEPEPEPEPVIVREEPKPQPVREEPKPQPVREEPPKKQEPVSAPVTIYNTITVTAKTPQPEPVPPPPPPVVAEKPPEEPAPVPLQTIPVYMVPALKAVPGPIITVAPVYSQPAPVATFSVTPVAAIPVTPVAAVPVTPVTITPVPVTPVTAAVPVKILVAPVQPQPQSPCPPASTVYSVSPQVVYAQAPQAYRQQPQPQPSLQQVYVQGPVSQQPVQPQAPQQQQQVPVQTIPSPIAVYTNPPSTAQGPVTVYTATAPTSGSPAAQVSATVYTDPPAQAQATVYASPQPQAQPPQSQSQATVYAAPPPVQAQASAAVIKPRMPDPASHGVYRVQVGSYADPQNAQVVAESLVRAGLSPAYEQYGQVWRVVIPGINVQQLTAVAQQLGALGVKEAWIRQEG